VSVVPLTDPVDDIHRWSCAEVAIIRGHYADAQRRVDAEYRKFAADIEHIAAQVQP